jgi:4-hydroxy-tetrahydrodipicolinate reductase
VTRVCVIGPHGRMGRAVLALARERQASQGSGNVQVVSALVRPGSAAVGIEVAPGVVATADVDAALAQAEVYIDFSTPQATADVALAAMARGVAGVVGTTGLNDRAHAALEALSKRGPVLWAPNFSPGVAVLLDLAERAARALGPEFDIEVVEIHHRQKRDAPSGTALAVAEALARGRSDGGGAALTRVLGRAGDTGARAPGELGIAAVRGGDVIGEHTAYLLGDHERIELTHRAATRSVFAAGALRAATWLAGKPAGRYRMSDVLGL